MSTLHYIDPKPFANAKPSNGKNTVAHNKAKVKASTGSVRSSPSSRTRMCASPTDSIACNSARHGPRM